jgi:GPI mannosyltransferase 1 subunit M
MWMAPLAAGIFNSTSRLILLSILLRGLLLVYGAYHDAHSPLKYTDVDYYVFTDAARYVSQGESPYKRETYRYTPLLAWILVPTSWPGWFSFGKVVFALGDIAAGWIMILILRARGMSYQRSLKYASIWLLNPMVQTKRTMADQVAVISTRGNAEGLLGFMTCLLIYLIQRGYPLLTGLLLGFSVHFKIYPFIYTPSILLALDTQYDRALHPPSEVKAYGDHQPHPLPGLLRSINRSRILFSIGAAIGFLASTNWMYHLHGHDFLQHTYLHHFSRLDHRHNFSPYHLTLYLSSAAPTRGIAISSLAFIPQLTLVGIVIPLALMGQDLATTMFAQTFAFVAFNKVCTSQVSTVRFL